MPSRRSCYTPDYAAVCLPCHFPLKLDEELQVTAVIDQVPQCRISSTYPWDYAQRCQSCETTPLKAGLQLQTTLCLQVERSQVSYLPLVFTPRPLNIKPKVVRRMTEQCRSNQCETCTLGPASRAHPSGVIPGRASLPIAPSAPPTPCSAPTPTQPRREGQ